MSKELVHSPLFRDPIYDGAADPVIIWNHIEKQWWMIYTNRRANVKTSGFEWIHGTDLGVASSNDGGHTFVYRGILEGLAIEPGRNTFWAPEIIYENAIYHMYVSYVKGVPSTWNFERHILHYTSKNLWDWEFIGKLPLSSNRCIDACVHKLPNGNYGLWYKDEVNDSHTYMVESSDLYEFHNPIAVLEEFAHEGPNVFRFKGYYWMIIDTWKGQGVYRSKDAMIWSRCNDILSETGNKEDDYGFGYHADVYVQEDEAYIFYFTHPGRIPCVEKNFYEQQRSSLQIRRLTVKNRELCCDREEEFMYELVCDRAAITN